MSAANNTLILRPSAATMLIFAGVLSPMWVVGLWNLIRFESYGPGLLLVGIPLVIWVYGSAGVRIVATGKFVEMRRLFWREWRLETDKVIIREGFGGDIPILPAFVLEESASGAHGSIPKAPFQKERLDELLEFLITHGAVRTPELHN
jgi:hypothetical protein